MGFVQRLIIFTLLFSVIASLQWSAMPADGDTIYACVGQDVTLPWTFNLSAGEEIISIEWLFKGSSEEMVAIYSHSAFLPLPAFSNRVQQVGLGGLTIRHVTPGDAGNYTIEVNGRDLYARHTILLKVSDGPHTTDGHLHVELQPDAILDTTTQQWSAVLTCGQFTFTSQPPYPVEWITPSGATMTSSTYTNGYFNLHLATNLQGGTYVCRVPQQYLSSACLHGNSSADQARVKVDSGEVRMMVVVAELVELRDRNQQLQQQLDAVNSSLTQQVSTVNNTLTQQVSTVNETLMQEITKQVTEVDDRLSRKMQDVATPRISFNAQSTRSQALSPPSHLQFDSVLYNQGDAFDSSTGDFTAPVSGTYFFIFHTMGDGSHYTDSSIKANGVEICRAYLNEGQNYDHGSCPAVVHLNTGDRVWVEPWNSNRFYYDHTTSFTGFLISEDPQ